MGQPESLVVMEDGEIRALSFGRTKEKAMPIGKRAAAEFIGTFWLSLVAGVPS